MTRIIRFVSVACACFTIASCGILEDPTFPDAGTETDTDSGTEADTDASTEADTHAGTDAGTDSDVDAGTQTDPDDDSSQKARWTYLVYMAADNNLEIDYWMDLDELATAGSGNGVHVIVQVDRAKGFDTSNGNWTDTRRFYIDEGSWRQIGDSLGEKNMGDPKTLSDFLMWAAENYPAEKFALVLWNHGDSWRSNHDLTLWTIADDKESGDTIKIADGELGEAIQAFADNVGPLEAVMFDACLMASFEVAHSLQGYANYMAGSGSLTYDNGIDYRASINSIKKDPNATGKELTIATAEAVKNISREKNSAAIDISKLNAVAEAIKELSAAVLSDSSLESPLIKAISQARGLDSDWRRYYIDLKDLAIKIEASSNSTIRPLGSAIRAAVEVAVAIALGKTFPHNGEATTFGGFNFMADYLEDMSYLKAYTKGTWASTDWDDVLLKLANGRR